MSFVKKDIVAVIEKNCMLMNTGLFLTVRGLAEALSPTFDQTASP